MLDIKNLRRCFYVKPINAAIILLTIGFLFNTAFAQAQKKQNQTILPGAWGDQMDGTYKNPVLMADYNNPEIIRVDDDFYLTSATHHFVGNPILHSKDLVNWTIVNRVFRRLDIDKRYNHPGQTYQNGSWAPTLVYHNNKFWYYFATLDEGVWLTKTDDPEKDWSPLQLVKKAWGWDSPYPLWDNDENCYMYRSFAGAGTTVLHKMSCSGDSVLDQGRPITLGDHQEGMRVFKKDGYYYMYGGAGSLYSGYNLCFRSKNPYGPYEKKKVLEQGAYARAARQGSLIRLKNDKWWACHFGYYEGYGRVLYLEPVKWVDGWPVIGEDTDGDGIGEPVAQWHKPNVGKQYPVTVPQSTDEFNEPDLGLQWMWNANPNDNKWSLTERPGFLRLYASPLDTLTGYSGTAKERSKPPLKFVPNSIIYAKNTLVQMLMGWKNSSETLIHLNGMVPGQMAGLCLFNRDYIWIGVVAKNDKKVVRVAVNDKFMDIGEVKGHKIWLKAIVHSNKKKQAVGEVFYSFDGKNYISAGLSLDLIRWWFEGTKIALSTFNGSYSGNDGGYIDIDWFRYKHDGPTPLDSKFTME